MLLLLWIVAVSLLTVVLHAAPGHGHGSDDGGEGTERALLLDTTDKVTADLAKNLLEQAGIPVILHSPDFDVAELGVAAHAAVRGVSVYVPAPALERARQVLVEAWGEEAVRDATGK